MKKEDIYRVITAVHFTQHTFNIHTCRTYGTNVQISGNAVFEPLTTVYFIFILVSTSALYSVVNSELETTYKVVVVA
jgi:hypothetical protein